MLVLFTIFVGAVQGLHMSYTESSCHQVEKQHMEQVVLCPAWILSQP